MASWTSPTPAQGRRPGRPRSSAADQAILDAAVATLAERGYDGLSVDDVARRAGVAKTTLYRRWPTKDHLVVAAVAAMQQRVPMPETGDVRADLVALTEGVTGALTAPGVPRLVAELAAAASRSPSLAEGFRKLWADRRAAAFAIIGRAVDRGELRAGLDPSIVVDQLMGPLFYRLLVTGDPLDACYARGLVDAALRNALPGRQSRQLREGDTHAKR